MPPPIGAEEKICLEARRAVADARLKSLFPEELAECERPPCIALCTSGGGSRAFLSTVGLLDALSRRGLVDAVTYLACLSGSSWATASWMATPQGTPNVFYRDTAADPWSSTAPAQQDATLDTARVQQMVSAPFVGRLAREIIAGEPMRFWEEHLRKSILEPIHGARSASLRFAGLRKDELSAGRLPIPLCTCIADGEPPNKYDWISFTPMGTTRYGASHVSSKSWSDLQPYMLSQLMAVWGSAFAFDWESAPDALKRLTPARYNQPMLTPLSGPDTGVTQDAKLGRLRDAGIASNVPIPVLLQRVTGRPVDIIIVMDASETNAGEAECAQLWRHRHQLPWLNETELMRPFGADEIVRLFLPPTRDDPVILYTMGYTHKSTMDTNYSEAEIRGVVHYMSRVVHGIESALKRVLTWQTSDIASPTLSSGRSMLHVLSNVAQGSAPLESRLSGTLAVDSSARLCASLGAMYRRYFTHMGMLSVAGTDTRLPFNSTYSKVSVSAEATAAGRRTGGTEVALLDLAWPTPPPKQRNFWLIVGTAGVGKSTLSVQLARDQGSLAGRRGWPFALILRVSCHVLVRLAARAEIDIIESIVQAALHDPTTAVSSGHSDTSPTAQPSDVSHVEIVETLRNQRCLIVFDGFDEAQYDARMLRLARRFFTSTLADGDEWSTDVLLTTRPQHDPLFFQNVSLRLALNPWDRSELHRYVDNYARHCRFLDPGRAMSLLGRAELASLSSTPLMAELLCHMVAQSLDGSGVSARAALAYCIGCLMERRPTESKEALDAAKLLELLQESSVRWHRSKGRWDWPLDPSKAADRAVLQSGFVCVVGRDLGEHGERLRAAMVHQTLAEYLTSRHICNGGLAYIEEGITLGKLDEVVLSCLADPQFQAQATHTDPAAADETSTSLVALSSNSSFSPSTRRSHTPSEVRTRLTKRFERVIGEAISSKGPNADFSADLERHGSSYATRAKWRDRLKVDRIMSFLAAVNDAAMAKAVIGAYVPTYLGGVISKNRSVGPLLSEAAAASGATCALDALRKAKLLDAQRAVLEAESNQQSAALRNLLQDRVAPTLEMAESLGNASLVGSFIDSMRHPVTGTFTVDGEREVLRVAQQAAASGRAENVPAMLAHCGMGTCLELMASMAGSPVDPWPILERVPTFSQWVAESPWVLPTLDALRTQKTELVITSCDDTRALGQLLVRATTLRSLELYSVPIDTSAAKALAAALPNMLHLARLVLSHTGLSDSAALELAPALASVKNLVSLDFRHNHVGATGCMAVCGALREHKRLSALCLEGNPIGDAGASEVFELSRRLPAMQCIDVRNCEITGNVASALGVTIAGPGTVQVIDLSRNPLGAASGFTQRLENVVQLQTLKLSRTSIDSAVVATLAKSLPGMRGLMSLDLSENPAIGNFGVECLARAFPQAKSLTSLDMSDIGLVGGPECGVLGSALDCLPRLSTLQLSNNDLGSAGSTALFTSYASGRSSTLPLEVLVARAIGADVEGCRALSAVVEKCGKMTWLEVALNPIGDLGAAALARPLRRQLSLTGLDLCACEISDATLPQLARVVDALRSLRVLRLDANHVGSTADAVLGSRLPREVYSH